MSYIHSNKLIMEFLFFHVKNDGCTMESMLYKELKVILLLNNFLLQNNNTINFFCTLRKLDMRFKSKLIPKRN